MAGDGKSGTAAGDDARHQVDESDPIRLTRSWMREAGETESWPNAVSLATSGSTGKVGCRTVLLWVRDDGLYFGTSLAARKARDLSDVPYAALAAFWQNVRQWRAEGSVELASEDIADTLFSASPVQEQLLIWASKDGRPQENGELASDYETLRARYADGSIPRPEKWRAFQVVPEVFEFWEADVVEWKHRCRRFVRDPTSRQWVSYFVGP